MEREAGIFNLALIFELCQKVCNAELLGVIPSLLAESVDEIEVDMVGLELGELLVKVFLQIFGFFTEPYGEFCGKVYSLAVAVF